MYNDDIFLVSIKLFHINHSGEIYQFKKKFLSCNP